MKFKVRIYSNLNGRDYIEGEINHKRVIRDLERANSGELAEKMGLGIEGWNTTLVYDPFKEEFDIVQLTTGTGLVYSGHLIPILTIDGRYDIPRDVEDVLSDSWSYFAENIEEFRKWLEKHYPEYLNTEPDKDKLEEIIEELPEEIKDQIWESELYATLEEDISEVISSIVKDIENPEDFEKWLEERGVEITEKKPVVLVSHLPPRHMDDTLAIWLIGEMEEPDRVEFIHPQDEKLEEYVKDPDVILVDVGMDYDPEYKNFDHHHDENLPSSIKLVLDHYGIELGKNSQKAIDIVDRIDRVGFPAVAREEKIPFSRVIQEMQRGFLGAFTPESYREDTGVFTNLRFTLERALDRLERIDEIKDILKADFNRIQNILLENSEIDQPEDLEAVLKNPYTALTSVLYYALTDEYKKEFEKNLTVELERHKKVIENTRVVNVGNLKVGISPDNPPAPANKIMKLKGVDMVIQVNPMNTAHTSIVKNTASAKTRDIDIGQVIDRVFGKDKKVFVHKTGFIGVVDMPIEEVEKRIDRIGQVMRENLNDMGLSR